jgi:hypothetical protein
MEIGESQGHILFVSVGVITGVNATLAVDADLLTNVPSVQVNTPLRHAEPNKCTGVINCESDENRHFSWGLEI